MNQINNIFENLENSDRVKVYLPSGAYLQGKKKRIQREMKHHTSNYEVDRTETGFTAVPFLPD